MKKRIKIFICKGTFYTILICLICSLQSCEKFLDAKPSSKLDKMEPDYVPDLLDDFDIMNNRYPGEIENCTDDFFLLEAGYNALASSKYPQDLYLWKGEAQQTIIAPGWADSYKVVYNANLALETLAAGTGSLDPTLVNTLKGMAYFFRAYAHHQVAQSYAQPYDVATAGQDAGIPIRTNTAVEVKSERGTVKETYDKIIADFLQALPLLPVTSTIASRPNKAACYAALARTYLSMQDYTNAGKMADECLKLYSVLIDYNSVSKTSLTPFPRFNAEVIFHATLSGSLCANPVRAKIATDLYNSYEASDLRKVVFYKTTTGGFRWSGNYNPVTNNTFFSGLATDEVYLIRAECYARANNVAEALADLNTLKIKRWNNTVAYVPVTASTAEEALRLVLAERRKELPFRGLRWVDLRRLNKDPRFQTTLSRTIGGVTYTLPPNDLRYVLLISQSVIDNSNLLQNPR